MANDVKSTNSDAPKTETKPSEDSAKLEATNPGTPEYASSPDVQAADRAGIAEGEIKALRDNSGLNGLAGHEASVKQWEASEAGKQFVKDSKNQKEAEAAAKAAHKDLDKDGVSDAVKKYEETVAG